MKRKKQIQSKRLKPLPGATCSADELAKRIAIEILTVGASGGPVRCNRAVMMLGKYPDGERDMGGRNAASIAFVVKEHLLAAGYPPNTGVGIQKDAYHGNK